jgi:phosphopantetheinyl transferase
VFVCLWKITESEEVLRAQLPPSLPVHELQRLRHAHHRRQWLASRLLAKQMLEAQGKVFTGFWKDTHRKIHFQESPYSLSISHAGEYAAVVIGKAQPVGIDIEQISERPARVRHKFLHPDELPGTATDDQLTLFWCAKEALYKLQGRSGLSFREQVQVQTFRPTGWSAIIRTGGNERKCQLSAGRVDDYHWVCAHQDGSSF